MTPRLRTVTSGIAQRLEARRRPVLVEQEVEAPHLVGAVVRAVARADAAVVDHVVQAFGAVRRGARPGRPPRTARSRTACRAPAGGTSRGLSSRRRRSSGRRGSSASRGRGRPAPCRRPGCCSRRRRRSMQALQPVHDVRSIAIPHLLPVVFVVGIQRQRLRRLLALLCDDFRLVLWYSLERRDADRRAPFHHVVFLRRREQVAFAGLRRSRGRRRTTARRTCAGGRR